MEAMVRMSAILVLGARGSALAQAQARLAQAALARALDVPEAEIEAALPIRAITTTGDKVLDRPLADAGGKGLFTKEVEEALIDHRIDVAVHSLKDAPTLAPAGLVMAAHLEREDPRDALICAKATDLAELPEGALVGAASLRRSAQLKAKRPDVRITLLRGNVQTRLNAVANDDVDATFLAIAGLNRLGIADQAAAILSPDEMLPAACQGIVALQCREDDQHARDAARPD